MPSGRPGTNPTTPDLALCHQCSVRTGAPIDYCPACFCSDCMAKHLYGLSFLQPWLAYIVEGYKPVENRGTRPPDTVIGRRIALHASRGFDHDGIRFGLRLGRPDVVARAANAARGAIVGTARLVGAVEVRGQKGEFLSGKVVGKLSDDQVKLVLESPWTFGRWGYIFDEIRLTKAPVPCKGALGFWIVPAEVIAHIHASEERA
jgi:hypothetical protein